MVEQCAPITTEKSISEQERVHKSLLLISAAGGMEYLTLFRLSPNKALGDEEGGGDRWQGMGFLVRQELCALLNVQGLEHQPVWALLNKDDQKAFCILLMRIAAKVESYVNKIERAHFNYAQPPAKVAQRAVA